MSVAWAYTSWILFYGFKNGQIQIISADGAHAYIILQKTIHLMVYI